MGEELERLKLYPGSEFKSGKVSKSGSLWWSGIRQVLMVMRPIRGLLGGHQHPCWECRQSDTGRQIQKADLGFEQPSPFFLQELANFSSKKRNRIWDGGGGGGGGGRGGGQSWISFLSRTAFPQRTPQASLVWQILHQILKQKKGDLVFWYQNRRFFTHCENGVWPFP